MKNSASINEDSIKISAGALLKIPVARMQNMEEIINLCKKNGIRIIASTLEESHRIDEVNLTGPVALVMGNEERGITPETRKLADNLVSIPQATLFDSLNVSVAAGILNYEIYNQRTKAK
jgi:23S rRNA (guanosine2251-2'-O)-methyltransferase